MRMRMSARFSCSVARWRRLHKAASRDLYRALQPCLSTVQCLPPQAGLVLLSLLPPYGNASPTRSHKLLN